MSRVLATYEAQRRVLASEYLRLPTEKQHYWLTMLVACQTPGIPIDDPLIRAQLRAIWGEMSQTYASLMA